MNEYVMYAVAGCGPVWLTCEEDEDVAREVLTMQLNGGVHRCLHVVRGRLLQVVHLGHAMLI